MRRKITRSRKDSDGDITAICHPGEWWSPVSKFQAIKDISSGTHSYYVTVGSQEVDIHVVNGENGPYLRTDSDKTTRNNLDELPDC